MLKIVKIVYFVFVPVSILILGWCFLGIKKEIKKVGFIDNGYVFDGFEMKKELEVKFKAIQETRKKQIDSLYNLIGNTQSDALFNAYKENYIMFRQKADEEQLRLKSAYDKQIWEKINEYARIYGNEHGYGLLFGANGQGTIMHGEEAMNVSESFLKFVNEKYSGK